MRKRCQVVGLRWKRSVGDYELSSLFGMSNIQSALMGMGLGKFVLELLLLLRWAIVISIIQAKWVSRTLTLKEHWLKSHAGDGLWLWWFFFQSGVKYSHGCLHFPKIWWVLNSLRQVFGGHWVESGYWVIVFYHFWCSNSCWNPNNPSWSENVITKFVQKVKFSLLWNNVFGF